MNDINYFPQPISKQIWDRKYKLNTLNTETCNDEYVEDTWKRIADAMANTVPDINKNGKLPDDLNYFFDERKKDFYLALENFKFLPAGRITAGAGSNRQVTLFNCFVMGKIPDNINGIFTMIKEAAITMQQGGGIGYDFSSLRPKDSPVMGVDADASGPTTFMDVWDTMCRTIMSAGARRGAMMATMSCNHPDIMDFITVKRDPDRLRMFNVSVLVTDAFMSAVKENRMWALCHKATPKNKSLGKNDEGEWIYEWVQAVDLWNLIMKSTYDYAEPGVLFVDRINKMNNLWYVENITATNPCGEQPLPPYGACLLGSINLTKMVNNMFEDNASIDFECIKDTTKQAVRMLDSVIDNSLFPLHQQREEAKSKRRMGIGVTGLADVFFMLGITYGTNKACTITEEIMKTITIAAYEQSIELARIYGPCLVTETKEQREKFCNSGFMLKMPKHIHEGIMEYGIRNALLTSIAPTGTISLYAGNVSSGIEPIFAPTYTRYVLKDDGKTKVEEEVHDYAVMLFKQWCKKNKKHKSKLDTLQTAQILPPEAHLKIQAAAQKWVDSSISKTINLPEDISFEELEEVYMSAYDMGCKGCTTYRPNDVTGSVLSIKEDDSKKEKVIKPTPRLPILDGQTYKLKWKENNFYVTINNHEQKPFEIFINTQDMSQFQYVLALTRMMSSVFRRGDNIDFVIKDLKSIMDPNGGSWVDGQYIPSFIALLGKTIEQHLKFLNIDEDTDTTTTETETVKNTVNTADKCPECYSYNMNISGGCLVCVDCGHSKCG
jgi:ribonucleoside-diphosphate reductase alpha chain